MWDIIIASVLHCTVHSVYVYCSHNIRSMRVRDTNLHKAYITFMYFHVTIKFVFWMRAIRSMGDKFDLFL